MDSHDVIATLNKLLETTRDGEQGFRTCADGVRSSNLKSLFEAAAQRCAVGAAELEDKIRNLGGGEVPSVARCIMRGPTLSPLSLA